MHVRERGHFPKPKHPRREANNEQPRSPVKGAANDLRIGLVEVVSLVDPPTNVSHQRILRGGRHKLLVFIVGGSMVRWLGSPDEHGTVAADRIHLEESQSVNTVTESRVSHYRFRIRGEISAKHGVFMARKRFGTESFHWVQCVQPSSHVLRSGDETSENGELSRRG